MSPFDDPARCLSDGTGEDECLVVNIVHQVLQLPQLEPGNDGENDIAVLMDLELTGQITPFAFIDGNAPAQFVDQAVFDDIAFAGNDRDTGIGFDPFHDIVDRLGGGEIGQHGIEGDRDTEAKGRQAENDDIQREDDLADSKAAAPPGVERQHFNPIHGAARAHGEADTDAQEEAAKNGDQQFVRSDYGIGDEQQTEAEQDDADQGFHREPFAQRIHAHDDQRQVGDENDQGQVEAVYFMDQQGDARDPAVEEVVWHQEALQGKTGENDAHHDEEDIAGGESIVFEFVYHGLPGVQRLRIALLPGEQFFPSRRGEIAVRSHEFLLLRKPGVHVPV